MKTRNYILSFLQALTMLVVMTAMMACSSSKDEVEEPPVPIPETPDVVKDPVKVTLYGDSQQFQTDLDALSALTLDVEAIRWTYWRLVSNDFKNGFDDFFTVPPDETGKDHPELLRLFYKLVGQSAEKSDTYQEALENLAANDILPAMDVSAARTRGKYGSTASFGLVIKECGVMSRQSVIAVLRKGGWTTDGKMLTQFYNSLPPEDRAGYKDPATFWNDFSQGKLDDRAGQIYVNLYTYEHLDFGEKSNDLGITPYKNTAIMAQKLAEAGENLILDAHPAAKLMSIGKDAFDTVEASLQLAAASGKQVFGAGDGDPKEMANALGKFLQQMGHNAANYGRDFYKWQKEASATWENLGRDKMLVDLGIEWSKTTDTFFSIGAEVYDFTTNEIIMENHLLSTLFDEGKKLGLNVQITFKEVGGQRCPMVIMSDLKTGEIRMGYTLNENGDIVMMQGEGETTKTITAVNRHTGKRVTKTVIIPKGEDAEITMRSDMEELEEYPKNGFIRLEPSSWTDNTGDAVNTRVTIKTNYMYYQCKTEQDWIDAFVAKDANFMYVKLKKNDKGKDPNDKDSKPEERRGAILVMATDSKGEVLNKTTMNIVQKPYVEQKDEGWVTADPSSIEMDGKGGTQLITLNHPNAFNYLGGKVDSSLSGWASLTASDDGYTLKVESNNTMEDRTGSITFYAAVTASALDDVMNKGVKADPELCATTVVVVKQAAGSTEIKLSPESVEFDAEGGTQKVTIDAGVYKHFEADPDDSSVSWLTVALGSGWSFDVKAKPNNGTEPRSGTVIVRCYNDAKDAGKTVTLKVTQKAIEEQYDVSVDPTELYFSSAMSSQEIAVNCDWDNVPYTHYGVRIPEEYKDWISGKVSGGKVIATVQPNMEFKKREGYINCYVRQKDRPEEEWVFMPVQIYQDKPSPVEASMKFIGKWTYENSRDDWYVEYSFGADGSYFCKWDTPSTKFTETGTYVISSYEEFGSGDVVMEAQLNERYTRDGSVNLRTETVKLVKYSGYIDGKWVEKGLRELQIGWNTYTKKN